MQDKKTKPKSKLFNMGISLSQKYKANEPILKPHTKRFIRKEKSFTPYDSSRMIKVDKLTFSFPKTFSGKERTEELGSFNDSSRLKSKRMIKVTTEIDFGLVSNKSVQSKVRRPKTAAPDRGKPKNMHLIDQERSLSDLRPKESAYRVKSGSSTNLNHLACMSKQPLYSKPVKGLAGEEVSTQLSLQVRPYSSNNLFYFSRTELSGGSRACTASDKKSRLPSAYNSGPLITVDVGEQQAQSKIKTAQVLLAPEISKQELTIFSKETSVGRLEGSRDNPFSDKSRPKIGLPAFFKLYSEKNKFESNVLSKR